MRKSGIEKREPEHLDQVLSIDRSSSPPPWSEEMFMEELRNPLGHCFIYKVEGPRQDVIAGFVCFRNVGEESELLNIGVHPLHRRMGIGRKLMQFYVDFSEGMQIKTFYLEVHISNPSEQFSALYEGVRDKTFGHIAGGIDREGRDFVTVYYGVEYKEGVKS